MTRLRGTGRRGGVFLGPSRVKSESNIRVIPFVDHLEHSYPHSSIDYSDTDSRRIGPRDPAVPGTLARGICSDRSPSTCRLSRYCAAFPGTPNYTIVVRSRASRYRGRLQDARTVRSRVRTVLLLFLLPLVLPSFQLYNASFCSILFLPGAPFCTFFLNSSNTLG